MYVVRSGAGAPPLVFVHGLGCSLEDWEAQRRALEPRYEVLACDLPGHGRTPGGAREATIANFAAEVAALLEKNSVLVGHSMGCRVILEAARRRPEQVAGLVLIDGSRIGSGDPQRAREAAAARIAAVGYRRFIDAFFAAMLLRPLAQGEALLERARRMPPEVGEALYLDIVRWDAADLDAALAAVRAPLMAIQSTAFNAQGKRVSLKAGESSAWLDLLAERVPGARLEVLPGIGHFPQIEAPDEVSRLVAEFAQAVRAASR